MMKIMMTILVPAISTLLSIILIGILPFTVADEIAIHGSGTTFPAKCLWKIMDDFMDCAKGSICLSYQATGGNTGTREFIGNAFGSAPASDFGVVNYPISSTDYILLTKAGVAVVQLPVLMSAVAVFHSIPTVLSPPVNVTACIMARIFKQEVTDWLDPSILEINQNLNSSIITAGGGKGNVTAYPIVVACCNRGSGTTALFTQVSIVCFIFMLI